MNDDETGTVESGSLNDVKSSFFRRYSGWIIGLMVALAVVAGIWIYTSITKINEARQRAYVIMCRNSLANLALASRLFATDHQGKYPDSWSVISDQVGSSRNFICPLDRKKYETLSSVSEAIADGTYRYEAAGAMEGEPGRVVTYCPFHGHILLTGGEVVEMGRPLADSEFKIHEGHKYVTGGGGL